MHEKDFWEVGANWARRSVASKDRQGFEILVNETHHFFENNVALDCVALYRLLAKRTNGPAAAKFLLRYQFYMHDEPLRVELDVSIFFKNFYCSNVSYFYVKKQF